MKIEELSCEGGPLDGCSVSVPAAPAGAWFAIRHSDGGFLIYKSRWSHFLKNGTVGVLLKFHDDNGVDRWDASAPRPEVIRLHPILADADPSRIKLARTLQRRFEDMPDLESWMNLLDSLGIKTREEFPFEADGFFALDADSPTDLYRGCFLPARRRSWLMVPHFLAMKILVLGELL